MEHVSYRVCDGFLSECKQASNQLLARTDAIIIIIIIPSTVTGNDERKELSN